MEILTKDKVFARKEEVIRDIRAGKIFIYPTDTIYGIGCNALNKESVLKIRELKKREAKPFSVIAPNKAWISANCVVGESAKEWIDKIPGAYTLILNLKDKKAVCTEANNGLDSLGVRMINHWFQEIVSEAGVPFITTSVNLAGEPPAKGVNECYEEIKSGVDYIIDEGEITGSPSTIVNLTQEKAEIVKR